MKFYFDTWEEYSEAMEHLSEYHDCEKCHGKIVCIQSDGLGNQLCAYCGQIVKYPQLKKEVFEKWLKEEGWKKQTEKEDVNKLLGELV